MATPTLGTFQFDPESHELLVRSIDDYFAAGDLGQHRGTVVSGTEHRAADIPPVLASRRTTPSATLNLDPFLGAAELASGNTLNLNDAQIRLSPEIQDLCDDFATVLCAHCQVNVYISVGDAPGFGAHWDDHDVVILPIAGSKFWDVEEPSAVAPVKDVIPAGGTGRSTWSGVLSRGNALYIPRGWPHRVSGIGEEVSVHLTISIRRPTALDLFVHLDAQRFEDAAFSDESDWITRADVDHCWGSWACTLNSPPRRGPIAAYEAIATGFADLRLHAVFLGGAVFTEAVDHDTIELAVNNQVVQVPRGTAPLIADLLDGWSTVTELAQRAALTTREVIDQLTALGRIGVLRFEAAA
jgi:hypothetical protein